MTSMEDVSSKPSTTKRRRIELISPEDEVGIVKLMQQPEVAAAVLQVLKASNERKDAMRAAKKLPDPAVAEPKAAKAAAAAEMKAAKAAAEDDGAKASAFDPAVFDQKREALDERIVQLKVSLPSPCIHPAGRPASQPLVRVSVRPCTG